VSGTFSAEELAGRAGVDGERIDWLMGVGILKPERRNAFRQGDVFRVRLIEALIGGGFSTQQIESAAASGYLDLDHVDQYYPEEPDRRSQRSFAEFLEAAGPRASLLPPVFEMLGLPTPIPAAPIQVGEEDLLLLFLEAWRLAPEDDTLLRAARLIAEGTRVAALGWMELLDEQIGTHARERLLRGEVQRFPPEVTRAFVSMLELAPRMMKWLTGRYLEQRAAEGIVAGFEQFLNSRGLGPAPREAPDPAVVFVDLVGYTRLTEQRGDETAVRSATALQQEAHAVAAANEGRLVKLLGDGAMLRFPDASRGVTAAVALVQALDSDRDLAAHAGIHTGPVVERDLDLFGRTVASLVRPAPAKSWSARRWWMR
jgi:adenylate cyclase